MAKRRRRTTRRKRTVRRRARRRPAVRMRTNYNAGVRGKPIGSAGRLGKAVGVMFAIFVLYAFSVFTIEYSVPRTTAYAVAGGSIAVQLQAIQLFAVLGLVLVAYGVLILQRGKPIWR